MGSPFSVDLGEQGDDEDEDDEDDEDDEAGSEVASPSATRILTLTLGRL